jgi:hypothetical protein
MSATSKEERQAQKHTFFLREFGQIQSAVRDVRIQCLQDRRFCSVPGAQWEGPAGEQFENKPRFEFNKVHLAVIRIINEYRNNRITVDFTSKDGTEADTLADTCDGLYRADEQDSGAQEAYDNCYEEGVSGGMGAFRLRARYVDEDDDEVDHQRVAMEPITDADTTVFFSLDGKRYDKADSKRCYVLNAYTQDAYEEEFDDSPVSWPKGINQNEFDWCTPDVVWVAEVYEVEKISVLMHYFRGIALSDDEPNELALTDEELAEDGKVAKLAATGFREMRKKRVTQRAVHKYLMSGGKILEDCGIIAGTNIPIIPFYGKRWYVDGIERCMGHVRLAKDAQMLNNMLMSWLAEMAARFDIEKPILTPTQVAGHVNMWAEDVIEKYPYLLLNPLLDQTGVEIPGTAAPVAYTKAPSIPPVMAALTQLAQQALEDLLGNQSAGEQLQPNQSGKAVELIQQRLDMQVFIYMSNFAKTIKRAGEVWLSMNKALLIEAGRKLKVLHASGKIGSIELKRPMIDEKTGERYLENDLSQAKFDVFADVGPSSTSRRAATVRALTGMMQLTTDPEAQAVLTSMVMMNMEGEGLSDVKAFFRKKLVTMGAVKPTKEEQAELDQAQQNQQPDPNAQFLEASARKALADEQLATAKVGLTHAQTITELAGVESGQQADLIALADALTPGPVVEAAPAMQQQMAAVPQEVM